MSQPLPGPARGNPRSIWLLPYIRVQQSSDRKINKALHDAMLDADKAIQSIVGKPGVGAAVRRAQLVGTRGALTKIINALYGKVEEVVRTGQIDAAEAAFQAGFKWDKAILKAIEPNAKKRALLERSLAGTADRSVQAMITRILKTERTLSGNVYSAKSLTTGQISRLVNSSLAASDSADDLAKKVKGFINPNTPGGAAYAARRLGRTEINNAFHAQSIQQNEGKPWVDFMVWHLSGSHRPVPGDKCELYARQGKFPKEAVPPKPHPQCVTGDTLIQFPEGGPIACTSRWHVGEFIEIHTRDGRYLTVTPNHPVFTPNGWVDAGKLNVGSRIVCSGLHQRETLRANPNKEHVPALAEEVAGSLRKAGRLWTPSVVGVVPEDFHGDGVGSDIAVVFTDSFLQSDTHDVSLLEPFVHHSVDRTDVQLPLLSSLGSLQEALPSLGHTTRSVVSSLSIQDVLLRSSIGPHQFIGLLNTPHFDAIASQPVLKTKTFDVEPENSNDFVWGFPGSVEFDDVVSIKRSESGRHVYNFQTSTGSYLGNSILLHNCTCYITPEVKSLDDVISSALNGEYDDYFASLNS